VNSNKIPNYTIKTSIKFPADLVTLSTWQYADDWMPLRKAGYDSFSNIDGTLVRTAGYPNGFTGLVNFGTATFVAKATGASVITFSGENLALDENNANQYMLGNAVDLVIIESSGESTVQELQETKISSSQQIENFEQVGVQLEQSQVSTIGDLMVRMIFDGFGSEPTDVNMSFDILDSSGNVVRSESNIISINQKGEYEKRFSDTSLPDGNYKIRATVSYGSMQNQLIQRFVIKASEKVAANSWLGALSFANMKNAWWILLIAILIIVFIIFILMLIGRGRNNRKT